MELTTPASQAPAPDLTAALDRLWVRFLPEMRARFAVLETASAAFASGNLSREQREAAQNAAHKLAGVLGTFGLAEGTRLARELENFFAATSMGDGRVAESTAALRVIIATRC